ncbi:hypothetical protein WR25_16260 [Diploscapter pachys]|uniref:BPTI/Kunitz inhibitor domain-containing protein n=1 Tax=Diploscapter pachys TaxID=2018661 RepID=A0A2A2L8F9_9BILA|nr:hypothetical protein WR25_16260 [Diploscapter pachys]
MLPLAFSGNFDQWIMEKCKHPLDRGSTPCTNGTSSIRFYLDPETMNCLAFKFTGCGGNSNNFEKWIDCLKSCTEKLVHICTLGLPPAKREDGSFNCNDKVKCSEDASCLRMGDEDGTCCSSKNLDEGSKHYTPDCGDKKVVVDSGYTQYEYYMDKETLTCLAFNFEGCSTNENNFETSAECYKECFSLDHLNCPAGSDPVKRKDGEYYCDDSMAFCDKKKSYCLMSGAVGLCCNTTIRDEVQANLKPDCGAQKVVELEKNGVKSVLLGKTDHLTCSAGSQPLKNKKGEFHCNSENDCVGKDAYCAAGAGTGLCCSKKVRDEVMDNLVPDCGKKKNLVEIEEDGFKSALIGKDCSHNFCPKGSICQKGKYYMYCCK